MATQPIKFVFEGDTSDLEKALSQVSRKFEKTKKESKEVAKDVSIFGRKFDQQSEKIGKFMSVNAKAFGVIAAGLGTVVLGFAAVAKAADVALGVIQKVTDEALSMAEAGDEIAKAAKRVGTTAEELQVVRFALAEGGVAAEQADMAMLKLNLRLAQVAETGKGPAAEALKKLGLNARELQALPLDERMARVADAFADMESQGEKTAAAVALMEEGGLRLLSAFDGGGDAIRESAAAIREMGVISNQSAADSEALIDAIGRLQSDINSLRFDVLAPLIPVLTGVARGVTKIIDSLDRGEVSAFGEAMASSMITAVRAIASLGIAAEQALEALKPVMRVMIALVQFQAGEWVKAHENMEKALLQVFDPRSMSDISDRWHKWFDLIHGEILAAVAASKEGAKDIEDALGGLGRGRGDGGDGDLGPATPVADAAAAIEEELPGDAFELIVDVKIGQKRLTPEEWANLAIESFAPVGAAISEIASSLGDLFSQIASNISDSISASEEELQILDERIENARTVREKEALVRRKAAVKQEIEEQKKAAMAAFVAQKVAALSQAAIATALASITAFAQTGQPGAAIAAAIAGGISIAAIAAEPPPSLHVGGMVAQAAPDEINARLLRSEAVLSPQGVNAVGGEDGVRQLNRGGGVGQQIVSVLQVRSRTVDAMISDNLRTKQGPLVDALRAARPRALGRHNPFASS
jgi:hypothetical protein